MLVEDYAIVKIEFMLRVLCQLGTVLLSKSNSCCCSMSVGNCAIVKIEFMLLFNVSWELCYCLNRIHVAVLCQLRTVLLSKLNSCCCSMSVGNCAIVEIEFMLRVLCQLGTVLLLKSNSCFVFYVGWGLCYCWNQIHVGDLCRLRTMLLLKPNSCWCSMSVEDYAIVEIEFMLGVLSSTFYCECILLIVFSCYCIFMFRCSFI